MFIIDIFKHLIRNISEKEKKSEINQRKSEENDSNVSNNTYFRRSRNEEYLENNIPLSEDMTQFPKTKMDAPKQQIVIGLDFGTAFTKVIIGEVRKCYAVPFKNIKSRNPYLLPCILNVGKQGICSLNNDIDIETTFSNLKMSIIDGSLSEENNTHIVAFLALVFRYSRFWFMNTHEKIYENRNLDWYVNVGLPTESYHDEKLVTEYRIIVMAAWALSILPEHVSISRAKDFFLISLCNKDFLDDNYKNLQQRLLHPEAISLFPEFVAQITGYVRSPLRKNDLHLMIDVGAGTLDISMFNVNSEEGENKFPIFTKTVRPLGTHYLMKHRLDNIKQRNHYDWTVYNNVPSKEEFAKAINCLPQKLTEIDEVFHIEVGKVLRKQVQYTKECRYPTSSRWQEGVPTFLCGGGGRVDFYRKLIKEIESNKNHYYKIKLQRLPKPERLQGSGLVEDEFELLSVAYGLSFNALDIGQIIRANEIEDYKQTVTKKDYSGRYISKDMI